VLYFFFRKSTNFERDAFCPILIPLSPSYWHVRVKVKTNRLQNNIFTDVCRLGIETSGVLVRRVTIILWWLTSFSQHNINIVLARVLHCSENRHDHHIFQYNTHYLTREQSTAKYFFLNIKIVQQFLEVSFFSVKRKSSTAIFYYYYITA